MTFRASVQASSQRAFDKLPFSKLPFSKLEGAGNDFLVVFVNTEEDIASSEAAQLCDRHFGVGGDGVLLVVGAGKKMVVRNADGSTPEMCGNGLRCVAWELVRKGIASADTPFTIDTDAGPRTFVVRPSEDGSSAQVTINMGRVITTGKGTIVSADRTTDFTSADAGNPHAVIFGPPLDRETMTQIGVALAKDKMFPDGVNAGFATMHAGAAQPTFDLVVFERGVGFTLACGTGACAAVVTAWHLGLVRNHAPTRVNLPGGTLLISREADGTILMEGPARLVYEGVLG
jgi:diaminopimelate epimerase